MAIKTFTAGEVLTASDTNTYLANSGLVYVAGATITGLGTSGANLTGLFNSTYKNYRVQFLLRNPSTGLRMDMRYIAGTTPTTSGYYNAAIAGDYASNTVLYAQRSNNDTTFYGQNLQTNVGLLSMTWDIFNPNVAGIETTHNFQLVNRNEGLAYSGGGVQIATTAFTGVTVGTNTGTVTLEYKVYGYREP